MLHADELAYCIAKKYPTLKRHKDYWVAHAVDETTRVQVDSAWIVQWNPTDPPQPTAKELAELWAQYGDEAIEWHLSNHLRGMRDFELSRVDPLVAIAEDNEDRERVKALRTYRQALRNVPQQPGFPFSVAWPAPPEESS